MRQFVAEGIHGAVLIGALGGLAWLLGQPFVFPSLGPTAYILIDKPNDQKSHPRNVLGGHVLGVVVGLISYSLFANGITLTAEKSSASIAVLRLVGSGTVAMAVTTSGMLWSDLDHPPACATTLIVALGLLTTIIDGLTILLAVAVLVVIEQGVKLAPYRLPRRREN